MIKMHNDSKKAVILIHEIYGINKHMEDTGSRYYELGYDVFCPDLLGDNNRFDYVEEKAAYKYFMENVGFEPAVAQVKKVVEDIRDEYEEIIIIGYSIDATIAWICGSTEGLSDKMICIYGSRIRDYTELTPKCSVLQIYSQDEKKLDVCFIEKSKQYFGEVYFYDARHGFCDCYSPNYNEEACLSIKNKVLHFLSKQSDK